MFFDPPKPEPVYVSRIDHSQPLGSFSFHPFHLDGAEWPTVEHYFHGLKFEDPAQRAAIRESESPQAARNLAEQHKRNVRKDWEKIQQTVMTRGVYIKCRTHPEVAQALLSTGDQRIVENTSYDYFWGCGRDGRGRNHYGNILMSVRDKLREEQADSQKP